ILVDGLLEIRAFPSALATPRDGYRNERSILRPRAVIVLDILTIKQLAEYEPSVAGTLTDPAVGDGVFRFVDTGVDFPQFIVGLEGSFVVRGLAPRHVQRTRNVAGDVRLLLRQVRGRE